MKAVKRVLVAGGGIAGLSAAIALGKADIEVDLIEIKSDFKVYHIGLILNANVVRAFSELGVVDALLAAGFGYASVHFCDRNGVLERVVSSKSLIGPRYPSHIGVTRPRLHAVLAEAAGAAGTNMRFGLSCEHIEQDRDQVRVKFSDGSVATYDFVVGADGIGSQVRSLLFGDGYQPQFTGQGAWRYSVPRPPEVTDSAIYNSGVAGGKAGYVPLSDSTMYVWTLSTEPGNPKLPTECLAEMFRERLRDYGGVLAEARDRHIVDSRLVVYRPLESLFMPAPWYRGRILLIGDAAHATTPHLGQGAAQAIEDALLLGRLLTQGGAIPELLEEFMRRRYQRCKFVVESSLQIGQWEQHPTPDADPIGLTAKMIKLMEEPI